MSTPYNESQPHRPTTDYRPTDLRDPLGNPVRRGDTVTVVDAHGLPVSGLPFPNQPIGPGNVHEPRPHGGYLIPPGVARQAEQQADAAPEPTVVDHITSDVANLPAWPAGAPELKPAYKLSFRQRGSSTKLFAELQQMDMPEISEDKPDPTPQQMVDMFEGLAKIDDFLVTVAADARAYRAWVEDNDDNAFVELWNAYAARTQPGEASSSSS